MSEPSQRFLAAATSLGHEPYVYRRFNRQGRRWHASALIAEMPRENRIRSTVSDLIIDGDRAVGVTLANHSSDEIRCRKGVVLCAGTIGTPTILMRSGIGCRDHLRENQIACRVDAPTVGQNLQDHLIMPVIYRLNHQSLSVRPSTRDLARWQSNGVGPISSNIAECGGLFESNRFQIHVTPTHYLKYPDASAAMTLGVNGSQPHSSGQLRLRSSNPHDPPLIQPRYLSDARDVEDLIEGVQLCRSIVAQSELGQWCNGELLPGAKRSTESSIDRAIRRYSQTLYHPTSTCRVGNDDEGVVDTTFGVRQIDECWIVDGSVLPHVTTVNPSVTIMMLAEHFCCTTAQRF